MSRVAELRGKVETARASGSYAGLSIWDATWLLDEMDKVKNGQPLDDSFEEKLKDDIAMVSQQRDRLKRKADQAMRSLRDIRDSYTATADELRERAMLCLRELDE